MSSKIRENGLCFDTFSSKRSRTGGCPLNIDVALILHLVDVPERFDGWRVGSSRWIYSVFGKRRDE